MAAATETCTTSCVEIRPWIMREIKQLQFSLAPEGLGISLADGGVPVEDLSQGYPEADWGMVLGEIFLETWGCQNFFLEIPQDLLIKR